DVARDEVLRVTYSDEQGRIFSGPGNQLRSVLEESRESVLPLQSLRRQNRRLHRVPDLAVLAFYQVCDHFAVRLALEDVSLGAQLLLQFQVVLDYPVVNYRYPLFARSVRVCVLVRDASVGRPTGVGDACRPGQGGEAIFSFDIVYPPGCLP